MIILLYDEIFFRLTAPRCPGMAAGAVSLRKSHDIVILSFCNIVKGQANYVCMYIQKANRYIIICTYSNSLTKDLSSINLNKIV